MEQPEQPARKKYLKLDKEAWEKVKNFVDGYFQVPEKAAIATYPILFEAISEQYPHIVLERKTFNKKVALIEDLKTRAGIPTKRFRKEHRCVPDRPQACHCMLEELCKAL